MKTTEDKPSTLSRHGPVRASLLGWNWTKSRPLTLFIGAALRLSPPRHAPQRSHLAANGRTCRLLFQARQRNPPSPISARWREDERMMDGGWRGPTHGAYMFIIYYQNVCGLNPATQLAASNRSSKSVESRLKVLAIPSWLAFRHENIMRY